MTTTQTKPEAGSPPASASDRVLTRPVLLVAFANACFFFVHTSYFPTFPVYIKALGGTDADIAFIVGVMGIISLAIKPGVGWLLDAWGRRSVLASGIAAMGLCAIGYGSTSAFSFLTFFRAIHSTSVGVVNTAGNTYVADVAPVARRAETLGYVSAIQMVASTVGPALGYAILTAPQLLPLNQYAFWWPDLQHPGEYNFAVLFVITAIVAVFGVTCALLVPEIRSSGPPRRPSLRNFIERRAAFPLLLSTIVTLPFAGILSYLPFYGPERGLDNVGLYFTFQAFGVLSSGLVLGRVSDRRGRKPVIVGTMATLVVAFAILPFAYGPIPFLIAAYLNGIAAGGSRTTLAAYVADRISPSERGAALSTLSMGFDFGVIFGAPILGFASTFGGFSTSFLTSAVIALIGTILAALFLQGPGGRVKSEG